MLDQVRRSFGGPGQHLTFVIAVNNKQVLRDNFLASPGLRASHPHEILLQENYPSAALAYNDAIAKSQNDLMVFVHQDIILPKNWISDMEQAVGRLDSSDPHWGVIGTYGETLDDGGRGYIYSSGLGILGHPFDEPVCIQTLDEIVLLFRKSSGLRFDERIPHFHMYGSDICLEANSRGRKNYAVSAFCIHNTHQPLVLGPDFYRCYRCLKAKWPHRLPIQTSCIRLTRFDFPMRMRRLREAHLRYLRKKEFGGFRASDIPKLLADVDVLLHRPSVA